MCIHVLCFTVFIQVLFKGWCFYKILREIFHENVDDEVNPWSSIIKQVFGSVLLKEYNGNDD
ncbi:hypothetical protein CEV08_04170 [Bartonella tribocorum]|uniref:Uncharacterized protein n=1 Tax=Bartonella tribocorum TaxID=85701 RepID=A0A2M6UW14_9HYPH|nr:hypothetical protein CEV08_04170 [Bartonella tribocorum]